jgi:nitrite reductase/ring-hydroxylating ferredoxin subunit
MTTSGRLRRYVRDLLAGRRPRRFAADAGEVAQIRAAITLRAARPGAAAPSEEFLSRLHAQLELEQNPPAPSRPAIGRRFVLVASTAAVAGVAVGGAVDRALVDDSGPVGDGTLHPNEGVWSAVATSAELPEGAVLPFNTAALIGYVQRSGGQVRAISGICSHQGCQLSFNSGDRELRCPCHDAAFGLTGAVLRYQLAVPPPALPAIVVREVDGRIEVFSPS